MMDLGPVRLRLEGECWMLYLVRPHFATGRIGAVCIPRVGKQPMPVRFLFDNAFATLEHLYEDEVNSSLVEVARLDQANSLEPCQEM